MLESVEEHSQYLRDVLRPRIRASAAAPGDKEGPN